MAQQDDLNVPMIATVGGISVLLTVATVYAVQAMYFRYSNDEIDRKVILAPTTDSDGKLAEQEAKLSRYSWVDRDAGTVAIPIERAMQLVVDELRVESPRSGETLKTDYGTER